MFEKQLSKITKKNKNPEIFTDFENGKLFWTKLQIFVVLPKFDENNIFQKFKKEMFKPTKNSHR
jgi:hypothetical protein